MQTIFYLLSRKIASHSNLRWYSCEKYLRRTNKSTLAHKYPPSMDAVSSNLLQSAQSELLQIFKTAVTSVMPDSLIDQKVKLMGKELIVNNVSYVITENVYLVGFGKAVAGMACSLEKLLGGRLKRGIVSVPHGSKMYFDANVNPSVVEYRNGAEHNQPDADSANTTELIVELVQNLTENDTLLTLISGGGSALLFSSKPSITDEDKTQLCRRLQNAGADITELNHVRKVLSRVKGGELAMSAYPARVLALILSDIIGDPIDFIASGPTCPIGSENPEREAIDILRRYNLYENLEENVKQILSDINAVQLKQNDKVENGRFKHVENILIGNNGIALRSAEAVARDTFNLESSILTSTAQGDVKDVSYAYVKLTKLACYVMENKFSLKHDFTVAINKENINILNISAEKLEKTFDTLSQLKKGKGIVLLGGGEPTVVVQGSGKGGRNQELSLRFSLDWFNEIEKDPILAKYFVLFLSAGTDGQDGPTDAAGAFGYPGIQSEIMSNVQRYEEKELQNVLEKNDSYTFYSKFQNGRNLVKIGNTGTNVMDLHFIYIKKKDE